MLKWGKNWTQNVLYNLLKNIALEHIFLKYMKPEDIEAEKERNQNFYN